MEKKVKKKFTKEIIKFDFYWFQLNWLHIIYKKKRGKIDDYTYKTLHLTRALP